METLWFYVYIILRHLASLDMKFDCSYKKITITCDLKAPSTNMRKVLLIGTLYLYIRNTISGCSCMIFHPGMENSGFSGGTSYHAFLIFLY